MKRSDWVRALIGIVLLLVAAWALTSRLRHVNLHDVWAHVRAMPTTRLLGAALLAAGNYLQLTLYDVLGLRYLGASLRYRRVALVSFIATAFGHNIGPSFASGGSVRYRFYSAELLTNRQIATLIGFLAFTFTVGFAVVGGATLLFAPARLSVAGLPPGLLRGIGAVLLALAALYAAAVLLAPRLRFLRRFQLPTPQIALGQLFVSGVDWLVMASILKLLLPADSVAYFDLLRLLFVAQFAGMVSQVPGGLGVFESLMVAALTSALSAESVLSTLLVYRVLYFFGPLVLAAGLLLATELRARSRLRPSRAPTERRSISPGTPHSRPSSQTGMP
jgi:uncharacterized membrane protein YbhN (UPF0104 family)